MSDSAMDQITPEEAAAEVAAAKKKGVKLDAGPKMADNGAFLPAKYPVRKGMTRKDC